MGVLPRLRDVMTHVPDLAFVTASGRRIGPLGLGRPRGDELEVLRSDLAAILHDAAHDDAEFLFNDSITSLRQDTDGVDVTFERASPRRFDLVIGADGLHSTVRGLVFAAEADCVRHLGLYFAALQFGHPAADPNTVLVHNKPGRSLTVHPVHPARGNAGVAFIFRSPAIPGLDHTDVEQVKEVIIDAYGGSEWQLPDLPDLVGSVRAATDIYFDAISHVRLPAWSQGRVGLVGDAAATVSLFGDGSSLALTGAHALAEALAASPDDHASAFRAYESRQRAPARAPQRGYSIAAAVLVPATRTGIVIRNLSARLLERLPIPGSHPAGTKRP